MKKKKSIFVCILILVGIYFFPINSLAQPNNVDHKSVAQLTLFPPLSTNGLNSTIYSNNLSFNTLLGFSKNENVFAFAGLGNIVTNNFNGFQFAGLFNLVKNEGSGVSFAGLWNMNLNIHNGVQFSGLFNRAKQINGFQFSGLCNVAQDVNGVQFAGLVNKAKDVSGIQIAGLINIAANSDYPIGLINLVKNGEKGIAVSYNEIGSTNITFRSGGKVTYGILGVGYNHKVGDNSFFASENGLWQIVNLSSFVLTSGIGAHINISPCFRVNNEISGDVIIGDSSEPTFKIGYALMPAFRIWHLEVFGGPNINYMQTNNLNNSGLFSKKSIWKNHGSLKMQQIYWGFQIGIQYIL